jgi:hypothetical protein
MDFVHETVPSSDSWFAAVEANALPGLNTQLDN